MMAPKPPASPCERTVVKVQPLMAKSFAMFYEGEPSPIIAEKRCGGAVWTLEVAGKSEFTVGGDNLKSGVNLDLAFSKHSILFDDDVDDGIDKEKATPGTGISWSDTPYFVIKRNGEITVKCVPIDDPADDTLDPPAERVCTVCETPNSTRIETITHGLRVLEREAH